jgi:hypothetical protein
MLTDSDTTLRSVIIWVCEGTWRATVDAALSLAPTPARFTVLHVRINPNGPWWQPPPTRTCSSWRVTATGPGSAPRAWAGPPGLSWIMPPVRCCSSGRTQPRTSAPCLRRHITLTLAGGEPGNPDRQGDCL